MAVKKSDQEEPSGKVLDHHNAPMESAPTLDKSSSSELRLPLMASSSGYVGAVCLRGPRQNASQPGYAPVLHVFSLALVRGDPPRPRGAAETSYLLG